ncbi:T9SS type A sorting domain-containing protein [bacterium]|nr:T9SS type A sorting domain-containing protein [bacterium]
MSRNLASGSVRILAFGIIVVSVLLAAAAAEARNPYRRALFDRYGTTLTDSQLDDLPSNAGHCGACHFDFDGGGTRNPYGLSLEVRLAAGMSIDAAIADVEFLDADGDGFSNFVELTDVANWSNTPTFPGLTAGNVGSVVNVDPADVLPYVTPSGGTDTTPPVVTVLSPAGGESWDAGTVQTVSWTAVDPNGIAGCDIWLSGDGGAHWKQLARGLPTDGAGNGSYQQFIPNLPGAASTIKVVATDGAGNVGEGVNAVAFALNAAATLVAPTTLRDFDMPGTQPFQSSELEDPSTVCIACHGEYDASLEPYHTWYGSMMAQSMRDPLYRATLIVAEEVAPSAGDLCIRCHSPGGWAGGRSLDTGMGLLNDVDLQGVQCDFCHRSVSPHYVAGVSPAVDADILAELAEVPVDPANGQFVLDPAPVRRGPYSDADPSHQWLYSDFTLSAEFCGTCHDVSNPVFVAGATPGTYDVDGLDQQHPDGDKRNMYPVERTFSEWSVSEYAAGGVYQPQFAGDRPDGMVSTCQDCHMRDVTGVGANVPGSPTRTDLAIHDLTGANTFVPDILPDFYPGLDTAALQDGKLRAQAMLSLAASMELTVTPVDGQPAVNVRITNETGHKLPSGYPEGRRAWIHVEAFDAGDQPVYESGHYDDATGHLTHDADAKVYEIEGGISTRLSGLLGVPAGPSFFFPLNDTVYSDNRIPPRGFTNANFEAVQSPPVSYSYADGQHWDDTLYLLPAGARSVEVTFYYQSTSQEYIEFLRDENHTDGYGQQLYDAWVAHGRATPQVMAQATALLDVTGTPDAPDLPRVVTLGQNYPNPFNPQTFIAYSLPARGAVRLRIYDERGRLVRALVDDSSQAAGPHRVKWDGHDNAGRGCASGVYHYVLETDQGRLSRKMTLVR